MVGQEISKYLEIIVTASRYWWKFSASADCIIVGNIIV